MDRYLTDEELKNTPEGELISRVFSSICTAIEKGLLKNCKLARPLITNDEEILEFISKNVECDLDYMYYIPVIGTKKDFLKESVCLKSLVEILSEFEGCKFTNNSTLVHINSVSIGDKKDKEIPYRHNVIFLFKNDDSKSLVS